MIQDIMAAVNAPSKNDGNGGLGDKNQWICEADNQNQCHFCGHKRSKISNLKNKTSCWELAYRQQFSPARFNLDKLTFVQPKLDPNDKEGVDIKSDTCSIMY